MNAVHIKTYLQLRSMIGQQAEVHAEALDSEAILACLAAGRFVSSLSPLWMQDLHFRKVRSAKVLQLLGDHRVCAELDTFSGVSNVAQFLRSYSKGISKVFSVKAPEYNRTVFNRSTVASIEKLLNSHSKDFLRSYSASLQLPAHDFRQSVWASLKAAKDDSAKKLLLYFWLQAPALNLSSKEWLECTTLKTALDLIFKTLGSTDVARILFASAKFSVLAGQHSALAAAMISDATLSADRHSVSLTPKGYQLLAKGKTPHGK